MNKKSFKYKPAEAFKNTYFTLGKFSDLTGNKFANCRM